MTRGRLGVVAVLLVFLLGGVLAGVLWSFVVDTETLTRTDVGVVTEGTELSRQFASDGWFALIGAVVAGVLGLGAVWGRRTDPLATLMMVLLGSVAASAICAAIGWWLGPSNPVTVLQDASVGSTAPARLNTHTWVGYLVWPLASVVGALCVLLVRSDSVDSSDELRGQPTVEV